MEIGKIFNGIKFTIDQPIRNLQNLFDINKYLEIYYENSCKIRIYYKGVVIARFNQKFSTGIWELELEPTTFLDRNIYVFKTYNKLFKSLIHNDRFYIKFLNNQWILFKE